MNDCMVSVVCTAYNHEKYIAEALESFLTQETSFPYEVVINDDASTDHTADIIRKYEQKSKGIIRAFYQTENMYSRHISVGGFLRSQARGKYIAVCEGDDYWIDSRKLQLQIDYMEKHPECKLCVCAGIRLYEDGTKASKSFKAYNEDKIVPIEDIIKGERLFPTASFVYRAEDYREPAPFQQDCKVGDHTLQLYMATKGTVYYIQKEMCVYRQNSDSSVMKSFLSTPDKAEAFYRNIIAMFIRFDEYTNKKYHEFVEMAIDEREYAIAFCKKDYVAIAQTAKFRKYSIPFKLVMRIFFRYPALFEWYRKLRYNKDKKTQGK